MAEARLCQEELLFWLRLASLKVLNSRAQPTITVPRTAWRTTAGWRIRCSIASEIRETRSSSSATRRLAPEAARSLTGAETIAIHGQTECQQSRVTSAQSRGDGHEQDTIPLRLHLGEGG